MRVMRVMRMLMDYELGARPEMRETEVFMLRGDEEEKKKRREEEREEREMEAKRRKPAAGSRDRAGKAGAGDDFTVTVFTVRSSRSSKSSSRQCYYGVHY